MTCFSWVIAFVAMFIVCFIGFNLARIKRDGFSSSSTTIQGLPPEIGRFKNDCNDNDSWVG